MPDSDPEIRAAAEIILEDMIADIILTQTMAGHREIVRGRAICSVCGTKCRSHTPLIPTSGSSSLNALGPPADSSSFSSSRTSSPQPPSLSQEGKAAGYAVGPEKGTGGSTGIGSGSGRLDGSGNAFFDCLVCNRAIASTRYAPHLSSCLGLNGSTRRTAARSAAVKARFGANDRSSPSPYVHSENGDSDGDSSTGKKTKSRWCDRVWANMLEGVNGNGKRGRSPSKPTPLGKKSKYSNGTGTPTGAARSLLPPSKLGQPPTNRSATGRAVSPSSSGSPEFSIVSSQGSTATSRKKLPGAPVPPPNFNQPIDMTESAAGGDYVPGDDSSDEGADDY